METEHFTQIELVTLRDTLNRRMGAKKIMKNMGINPLDQLHIARAFIPKPALSAKSYVKTEISARENQVIQLLCGGLTCQDIANCIFVSINTVKTHITNIYNKTGCANRAELYTYAFLYNII